jgi:flagellar P-ring protein precursor FlgI
VISRIENLEVQPQQKAKVVLDQRSGTIVIGEDVRISRVAVAQGALTLRVEEAPLVVQPNPFSDGQPVVVPRTAAGIEDRVTTNLAEVAGGTNLSEIVAGLSALGVGPRDLIDILTTIHAAGALHAELVVR